MSAGDTPSVGRIVHYVSYGTPGGEYGPKHVAAIITDVRGNADTGWEVRCKIFNPDGDFNSPWMVFDDSGKSGTVHWPERV